VGFDGAEEILEGLAKRTGGIAPALLLQALSNARATDGRAVSELVAAFRDPRRRGKAISMGVDLAADSLQDTEPEKARQEVSDALEELRAVDEGIAGSAHESLMTGSAPEPYAELDADHLPAAEPAPDLEQMSEYEPVSETEPETPSELESGPITESQPSTVPEPKVVRGPARAKPPVVDWTGWQRAAGISRQAPVPRPDIRAAVSDVGKRPFEARAVLAAMGAASSVLSQLRVLRRELSGFRGSSVATLREFIEWFPDGWARRRALCALLEEGIPSETEDALELVACLGSEIDRRWSLGLLARRGVLRGSILKRALDLVDSTYGKKRLKALAG
jgi:hypothetical protein